MARATNSPASRKRRKKVLKYAKGYFGNKSKLYRYAKEAVQHAWQYAFANEFYVVIFYIFSLYLR